LILSLSRKHDGREIIGPGVQIYRCFVMAGWLRYNHSGLMEMIER
jgi:hypothetical protein